MQRDLSVGADEVNISYVIKMLWWNWRTIALITVLTAVLGSLYVVVFNKTYEAGFKIIIQNEQYQAAGGRIQKIDIPVKLDAISRERDWLLSSELIARVYEGVKVADASISERFPTIEHLRRSIEVSNTAGVSTLNVTVTAAQARDAGTIARLLSEIFRQNNAERFASLLSKDLGSNDTVMGLEREFLELLQRNISALQPLDTLATEKGTSNDYLDVLEDSYNSITRLYALYLSARSENYGMAFEFGAPRLIVEIIDRNFAPTTPKGPGLSLATIMSIIVGIGVGTVYVLFAKRGQGVLFDARDVSQRFPLPIWGDLSAQDIAALPASGEGIFRDIRSALLARNGSDSESSCEVIHSWNADLEVPDTKLAQALGASYGALGKTVLILAAVTDDTAFEVFDENAKATQGLVCMRLGTDADAAVDELSTDSFKAAFQKLHEAFDVIILCSEGIGAPVRSSLFFSFADVVMLNVVKSVTKEDALAQCLSYVQSQDPKPTGIVLIPPKSFPV